MIMRNLLLIMLYALAAWASPAQAAVVSHISYTDRLNRTIAIPVPVQRAVFLQMYELLPVLDVWDKVVGVASYACRNDLTRAARPDIETIPSVGSGANANVEAIMQLKPDLVITWAWKPESIRFMEGKGLRVITVYPENIGELYEVMRLLGRVFQREDRIKAAIAEMETTFSLIRERTGKRQAGKKRTMLYLGGEANSVSGTLGINHDLMTMIGGVNLAGTIKQRNTLVSMEQIVAWNPEVIFIWGNAGYTARDIVDNPQWRNIRAVREGRVFKAPEWTTWSPRLAMVALWMAKQAYPEDYKDIDVAAEAKRFCQKVFHSPSQPKATP
ncbi:MAG: ABC transporter substrate-binding protein [Desulfurivibrionaceae bacterium]